MWEVLCLCSFLCITCCLSWWGTSHPAVKKTALRVILKCCGLNKNKRFIEFLFVKFYISWSKWINSHSTLEYLSCRWMLAEWTLQARGGTWSLEISPSNRLILLIWCLLGEILFFIKLYLSLQVQATVLGFLAALVASALGWILEKELILNHVALLCCCSVVTAFTASLLQGLHPALVSDHFLST